MRQTQPSWDVHAQRKACNASQNSRECLHVNPASRMSLWFQSKEKIFIFFNNAALWSGSDVITPGLRMVRGEIAAFSPLNSNAADVEYVLPPREASMVPS